MRIRSIRPYRQHQAITRTFEALQSRYLLAANGLIDHTVVAAADIEEPRTVQAADLDGDGDMDAIVSSAEGDLLHWLENTDGLGNFAAPQSVGNLFLESIESVLPADLNNDGDVDLVVSAYTLAFPPRPVVFYIENSGEEFEKPIAILEDTNVGKVIGADLNGDLLTDVVAVGTFGDGVLWLPNVDGTGTFGPPTVVDGQTATSVDITDIDSDMDEDVVVVRRDGTSSDVVWFENNGSGDWETEATIGTIPHSDTHRLVAFDVDGDSDADVGVVSCGSDFVWFENLGGVTFGSSQSLPNDHCSDSPAVADLDGDNDGDLLLGQNKGKDEIVWLRNEGSGAFSSATTISDAVSGSWSVFAHAADINGDGAIDVLSASDKDAKIALYENTGEGGFGSQELMVAAAPTRRISLSKLTDISGDGSDDLIVFGDGVIGYRESLGAEGGFAEEQAIDEVSSVRTIATADLDSDDSLDIIVARSSGLRWYSQQSSSWIERDIPTDTDSPDEVVPVDVDSDGDNDLVLYFDELNDSPGQVAWMENLNGLAEFGPLRLISDRYLSSVSASDVDLDGYMDVLATTENPNAVVWFRHTNGQGGFSFGSEIWRPEEGVGDAIRSVIARDADGDGDGDFFLHYYDEWSAPPLDVILLIENESIPAEAGDPIFADPIAVSDGAVGFRDMAFVDVGSLRKLDVISAYNSPFSAHLELHPNANPLHDSAPSFDPEESTWITSMTDVNQIDAGDVDGDGDWDLVATSSTGEIRWFENRRVVWGDINRNGVVEFEDFLRLSNNFGKEVDAAWEDGDFNVDGRVDFADFLLLSSNYDATG